MQSFKLFANGLDRERFETMADLYSIFIATETLERAYIRDAVSHSEYDAFLLLLLFFIFRYTSTCSKLIAQYKTSISSLGHNFDIRDFVRDFNVGFLQECSKPSQLLRP